MTQQPIQENVYIAFLKQDYDTPRAVRLNRFDQEVKELLAWGIPNYKLMGVAKEKHLQFFDESIIYPKFMVEMDVYSVRTDEYDAQVYQNPGMKIFPDEEDLHNEQYQKFIDLFIYEEPTPFFTKDLFVLGRLVKTKKHEGLIVDIHIGSGIEVALLVFHGVRREVKWVDQNDIISIENPKNAPSAEQLTGLLKQLGTENKIHVTDFVLQNSLKQFFFNFTEGEIDGEEDFLIEYLRKSTILEEERNVRRETNLDRHTTE